MTRVSLARIIADDLATLRRFDPGARPGGRPRRVVWSEKLPGFGVRYYASGRSTYIVQSLMNGIMDLTWSEVKGGRLLLHDSKTGPRTVWLGDEAQTLLASLERRGGADPVFWNKLTRRPVRSIGEFWKGVKVEANLPGVRIHDLRHSFASHAAARSETLPMIGKLVGHPRLQTTSRYASSR
jgi:site-specific recombinase XerC